MPKALPPPAPHHDIQLLYRHHGSWLKGWLRKRLGDRERAEDLTHDTFLRLLTSTVAQPLLEPRNFLATVARRAMIDHLRRKQLEQAYLQALAREPVLYACSPEAQVMLFETLMQLDTMFDGLDHKVRHAFLLAQLDGLDYTQIAQRLGVSISSVTKYIARATEHCLLFMLDAQQ
ncbi:RNA polymerase sigma factor FecI [Pseudomonas sp. 3A(2025)]